MLTKALLLISKKTLQNGGKIFRMSHYFTIFVHCNSAVCSAKRIPDRSIVSSIKSKIDAQFFVDLHYF